MKTNFKSYFSFTRKERTAIFVLVVLILFIWLSPNLLSNKGKYNSSSNEIANDVSLVKKNEKNEGNNELIEKSNYNNVQTNTEKFSLFVFDPNTLDVEGWRKLGLKEKTISTIKNYLKKGGKFKKPDDIKKIYGISMATAETLIPYINIEVEKPVTTITASDKQNLAHKENLYKVAIIDINTSDAFAFETLPGIGEKLSARIINFREKLGGFISVNQISETYGLPDSTFKLILPLLQYNEFNVRKININTADINTFKSHPYIRYAYGNVIIKYRETHGKFTSVNDLQNIMAIPADAFEKMKPYLTIE